MDSHHKTPPQRRANYTRHEIPRGDSIHHSILPGQLLYWGIMKALPPVKMGGLLLFKWGVFPLLKWGAFPLLKWGAFPLLKWRIGWKLSCDW